MATYDSNHISYLYRLISQMRHPDGSTRYVLQFWAISLATLGIIKIPARRDAQAAMWGVRGVLLSRSLRTYNGTEKQVETTDQHSPLCTGVLQGSDLCHHGWEDKVIQSTSNSHFPAIPCVNHYLG